ncbi:hypothetical protein LTR36_010571 [Oleoguttula mirabilis]|uniref:Uncharacterized protein n=1 Tax=Oleoguttula mirabilis TaxID=1507867 RepID=A0AAV9JS69_9PEZI|nr:hypothetical protein LTR36_010571 [Oleoguttula mirabilis]
MDDDDLNQMRNWLDTSSCSNLQQAAADFDRMFGQQHQGRYPSAMLLETIRTGYERLVGIQADINHMWMRLPHLGLYGHTVDMNAFLAAPDGVEGHHQLVLVEMPMEDRALLSTFDEAGLRARIVQLAVALRVRVLLRGNLEVVWAARVAEATWREIIPKPAPVERYRPP